MQDIESSPPLQAGVLVAVALSLAAVQFWRPLLRTADPVAMWQYALAAVVTTGLVAVLAWFGQAKRYVLTSEALHVHRAIGLGSSRAHPLAELASVGVVGAMPLGNTVIVVAFRGGVEVRVPRYYTNASALFRSLFSRLGTNIASKNAA